MSPEICLPGKSRSCPVDNVNHHAVLKIGSWSLGVCLGHQVKVQERLDFPCLVGQTCGRGQRLSGKRCSRDLPLEASPKQGKAEGSTRIRN